MWIGGRQKLLSTVLNYPLSVTDGSKKKDPLILRRQQQASENGNQNI
jgi:hypothetical protein